MKRKIEETLNPEELNKELEEKLKSYSRALVDFCANRFKGEANIFLKTLENYYNEIKNSLTNVEEYVGSNRTNAEDIKRNIENGLSNLTQNKNEINAVKEKRNGGAWEFPWFTAQEIESILGHVNVLLQNLESIKNKINAPISAAKSMQAGEVSYSSEIDFTWNLNNFNGKMQQFAVAYRDNLIEQCKNDLDELFKLYNNIESISFNMVYFFRSTLAELYVKIGELKAKGITHDLIPSLSKLIVENNKLLDAKLESMCSEVDLAHLSSSIHTITALKFYFTLVENLFTGRIYIGTKPILFRLKRDFIIIQHFFKNVSVDNEINDSLLQEFEQDYEKLNSYQERFALVLSTGEYQSYIDQCSHFPLTLDNVNELKQEVDKLLVFLKEEISLIKASKAEKNKSILSDYIDMTKFRHFSTFSSYIHIVIPMLRAGINNESSKEECDQQLTVKIKKLLEIIQTEQLSSDQIPQDLAMVPYIFGKMKDNFSAKEIKEFSGWCLKACQDKKLLKLIEDAKRQNSSLFNQESLSTHYEESNSSEGGNYSGGGYSNFFQSTAKKEFTERSILIFASEIKQAFAESIKKQEEDLGIWAADSYMRNVFNAINGGLFFDVVESPDIGGIPDDEANKEILLWIVEKLINYGISIDNPNPSAQTKNLIINLLTIDDIDATSANVRVNFPNEKEEFDSLCYPKKKTADLEMEEEEPVFVNNRSQ